MTIPGVAFAFRFGNEDGFVQQFFAKQRDLVARELGGAARCLLVFKELGNNPVYSPRWAVEAQTDLYDFSLENREHIKRFVRENQIVVIMFQGNDPTIDLKFLRRLGVRTVSTEDHSFNEQRQSFARAAAKFVLRSVLKQNVHDIHIANTRGQYDFLRKYARLPRRRLRTVPYGIDPEFYYPADHKAACSELGLDPDTVWIMAASQSRPEKRVDLLINAVRRVKEARPLTPIGFFYVGDGLMLTQWKALAQSLPSAADYRFFGKQTDMRPFYHAASVFIHGAARESFGLVLAEAMASGLPVISTRAHGPTEIIRDGRSGYLIERDDWDAFVTAMLSYIDCPELSERHGTIGRQICLEYYTSDREASELANLIRPLLGSIIPSGKGHAMRRPSSDHFSGHVHGGTLEPKGQGR